MPVGEIDFGFDLHKSLVQPCLSWQSASKVEKKSKINNNIFAHPSHGCRRDGQRVAISSRIVYICGYLDVPLMKKGFYLPPVLEESLEAFPVGILCSSVGEGIIEDVSFDDLTI